jgi:hypothetical protein
LKKFGRSSLQFHRRISCWTLFLNCTRDRSWFYWSSASFLMAYISLTQSLSITISITLKTTERKIE